MNVLTTSAGKNVNVLTKFAPICAYKSTVPQTRENTVQVDWNAISKLPIKFIPLTSVIWLRLVSIPFVPLVRVFNLLKLAANLSFTISGLE